MLELQRVMAGKSPTVGLAMVKHRKAVSVGPRGSVPKEPRKGKMLDFTSTPLSFASEETVFTVSIRLSGFFDESGKFHDHQIISFCGFLGRAEQWNALQVEWNGLLLRYGIASLHMSGGMLNFKRSLSSKHPALGKDSRIKVLKEFIKVIKRNLNVAIANAVHVKDYQAQPEHHKSILGGDDPYYWSFSQAMAEVLGYLKSVPGSEANIIVDDEEKYFVECYKLMARFKRGSPETRKCFISMCAADDEKFPQLQAADLLAYLTRNEAGYKFLGIDYDFRELYEEFSNGEPDSFAFSPVSVFWNTFALNTYVNDSLELKRQGKKKK